MCAGIHGCQSFLRSPSLRLCGQVATPLERKRRRARPRKRRREDGRNEPVGVSRLDGGNRRRQPASPRRSGGARLAARGVDHPGAQLGCPIHERSNRWRWTGDHEELGTPFDGSWSGGNSCLDRVPTVFINSRLSHGPPRIRPAGPASMGLRRRRFCPQTGSRR